MIPTVALDDKDINSISNTEVEIGGYEIIRQDRNRNGGGVAIYLRNNISYVKRSDDLISEHAEPLCLEIKKPKSKPIVSTWYRPPDSHNVFLQC